MKIDLHCHTKGSKGEKDRNVSVVDFCKNIKLANVKAVAITNHNCFDKEQFDIFSAHANNDFLLWPGIELDIIGNNNHFHVLVISDPDEVELFDELVQKLKIKEPISYNMSFDIFLNYFKDLRSPIIIPHYLKSKKDNISDENLEILRRNASSKYRILCEPSNLIQVGILQANGFPVAMGTDNLNWTNYVENNIPELIFDIDSYKSFIKLIDKDIHFIKSLIDTHAKSEEITVYGDYKNKRFPFRISIYDNVNIIFGDKGSGKSEIIDSLIGHYSSLNSYEPVIYRGGNEEEWYKEILAKEDDDFEKLIALENLDYNSFDENLSKIKNYKDIQLETITRYIKSFETKSNNENRKKMMILKSKPLLTYDASLDKNLFMNSKEIKMFIEKLKGMVFIGDLKNDVLKVIEKLNEFQKYQIKYAINKYISNLAIYYTDWTIDQLNDSATNLTGELSIPKETSFYKFSKNILDLKTSTDYIINLLNIDLKPTNIEIGHIESKGLIKLTTKNQLVSSRSIDGIDATTLLQNKKDIKPVLKLINKINNEFMIPNDLVQEINKYTSINHLKDFISIEKYLSLNSEKYIPSKGEKAILAIQHKVISKTNNTHFILDEPELSLSNIYINKDIVPLINKLAYEGKTIIVATHNPNLAVRTRPINTLLKQTDNNVYRTYIGNMFSNTLKNIIDNKDIKSWKDESIKHLEGGKDAFNERGYYYENN